MAGYKNEASIMPLFKEFVQAFREIENRGYCVVDNDEFKVKYNSNVLYCNKILVINYTVSDSRQKLTRTQFSFRCTHENPMPKHRWDSYLRQVKAMMVDHFVRTYPNTTRCSSLALKFLRDQQSSVKYKGTSESLERCVML